MNIGIIGTGNIGGALATKWSEKGHNIFLGVKDTNDFKGKTLLKNRNTVVLSILDAVAKADVILIATPAKAAVDVAISLGDTKGKIIIDAMNIVMGNGPEGYTNSAQAILDHTSTDEVVKCFNTTGYNNIDDPDYNGIYADMFTCGDSEKGKEIAMKLSKDAGFGECYDIGRNDKFDLIEQLAFFWINLAMFQGQGREIAFKLLKR